MGLSGALFWVGGVGLALFWVVGSRWGIILGGWGWVSLSVLFDNAPNIHTIFNPLYKLSNTYINFNPHHKK